MSYSEQSEEFDKLASLFGSFPTERKIELTSSQPQPKMAQPTIRDYLDTVPPFNGDPILISNFILACENILDTLGRPTDNAFNSFLIAHIRNKLTGRAAQLISVRNLRSWPELKEAILFTFGDQRDEDALMRDLTMLKQENNETSLRFGEKCQDILSLLLSRVNSTEINEILKAEKIRMYRNLAVKTFIKGVKEPYSLIVRCRNPQTLEEAINIISEENNLNYIRKMTNNNPHINHNQQGFNRNVQINHQMPRRQPIPAFNPRPPFSQNRPNFNQINRPYQWPSRPNYWQAQMSNQAMPRMQNNVQNPSIQRRSIQNYPIPMDTSSGNTNIPRPTIQRPNNFQRTNNVSRPNFTWQELHYADVDQDNNYEEEYPTEEQYDPSASCSQPYFEAYESNMDNFDQYVEQESCLQEQEPISSTTPENQDFQKNPPTKPQR